MRLVTNIGRIDQALRIGVGLLLLVLFGIGEIGEWGLVGLLPLATGMVRFCPLYAMLGIHTCGTNAQPLP